MKWAGVKTGRMCPLIFVPPELPAEKEAEPSRRKEVRVSETEGVEAQRAPRDPVLSQADQWLEACSWGLHTGPLLSRPGEASLSGLAFASTSTDQSRKEVTLDFAAGPS